MLSFLSFLFNYICVLDCSIGEAYCSLEEIDQLVVKFNDVALAWDGILDLPRSIEKVLYTNYTIWSDSYQH